MVRLLHRLSGFFFYLLAGSLFVAYVLLKNGIEADSAARWLQFADLPLAFTAIVYGGMSLYGSLADPGKPSKTLAWSIAIPLALVFALVLTLNFWPW